MPPVELFLSGIKQRIFDNAGHWEGDPFGSRPRLFEPRVGPVEIMLADISGIPQNPVDKLNSEQPAVSRPRALEVQSRSHLLDAKRARITVAEDIATEDKPDGLGFLWVDLDSLLDPGAARLGRIGPIAERRARAVPISERLPGWTAGDAAVRINGRRVDATADPASYLHLTRIWCAGDRIELDLPMRARWEWFEDKPDVAALVYGPVVLAQQFPLGEIPEKLMHENGPEVDKVATLEAAAAPLPRDLPSRLLPVSGKPLHFTADVGGGLVEFRPINDSWQRYSVYSQIA